MKKLVFLLASSALVAFPAIAKTVDEGSELAKNMFLVTLGGIEQGTPIAEKFAFCKPDGKGKTTDAANLNPAISWSGAPAGTKSYAVVMVDGDVPARAEEMNQDGKTIASEAPRRDFYHWLLVDIPAATTAIPEGADSKGKPEGGKAIGKTPYGITGQNDFAQFMKGTFGGYDGPCPPWNDSRLHHYRFYVYALDTETLGLSGNFTGTQAMDAINQHKLGFGMAMGTYTNKP